MLNIVMPLAGRGKHFSEHGVDVPKPLFPIGGAVPMCRVAIDNCKPKQIEHRFIFVVLREHCEKWGLDKWLKLFEPTCEVVITPQVLQGTCMSVLHAEDYFHDDNPLMIVNSDQWVKFDNCVDEFVAELDNQNADGVVLTTYSKDLWHSFAKLSPKNEILRIVEKPKELISTEALVGLFTCRHGSDFVKYADKMVEDEFTINDEYYVAPVFDYMLRAGKRVGFKNYKQVAYIGTYYQAAALGVRFEYGFDYYSYPNL